MTRNYEQRRRRVLNGEGAHSKLTAEHRDLLNRWSHDLENQEVAESTHTDYLEKLSIFLREAGKPVEEIDKEDALAFLSGKARSTKRTYKTTLRQFFLWYYRDHLQYEQNDLPRFVENQLKVTGTHRPKKRPEDIPKKEEVKELMQAAYNHRDRALIALLADVGCRISEALTMQRRDVDWRGETAVVQIPTVKKGVEDPRRQLRKDVLTFSRPALKDWWEASPVDGDEAPLFCNLQVRNECTDCGSRGEQGTCDECGGRVASHYPAMTYDAARVMLNGLKDRPDVDVRDHITLHKFRDYSVAEDKRDKHMTVDLIMQAKGWDDRSMLERYGPLGDSDVEAARIRQMIEDGQLDPNEMDRFKDENGEEQVRLELIRCPACHKPNSPERERCDYCSQPFSTSAAEKQAQLMSAIRSYIDEKGLTDELVEQVRQEAPG